ncbi:MAG: hypothetical protein ACTSU5_17950 [Promethearchaeota archaeon]
MVRPAWLLGLSYAVVAVSMVWGLPTFIHVYRAGKRHVVWFGRWYKLGSYAFIFICVSR